MIIRVIFATLVLPFVAIPYTADAANYLRSVAAKPGHIEETKFTASFTVTAAGVDDEDIDLDVQVIPGCVKHTWTKVVNKKFHAELSDAVLTEDIIEIHDRSLTSNHGKATAQQDHNARQLSTRRTWNGNQGGGCRNCLGMLEPSAHRLANAVFTQCLHSSGHAKFANAHDVEISWNDIMFATTEGDAAVGASEIVEGSTKAEGPHL